MTGWGVYYPLSFNYTDMEKDNKYNLTPEEMFALDSWLINQQTVMAYVISRRKEPKADPGNIPKLANRWLSRPNVQEYINERNGTVYEKTHNENNPVVGSMRTKEQIITAMELELPATKGKARTDLLMKLADLQAIKNEIVTPPEQRVLFYLPLHQCDKCPYTNNLAKTNRHVFGDAEEINLVGKE